jgi:hypothetical protein
VACGRRGGVVRIAWVSSLTSVARALAEHRGARRPPDGLLHIGLAACLAHFTTVTMNGLGAVFSGVFADGQAWFPLSNVAIQEIV